MTEQMISLNIRGRDKTWGVLARLPRAQIQAMRRDGVAVLLHVNPRKPRAGKAGKTEAVKRGKAPAGQQRAQRRG